MKKPILLIGIFILTLGLFSQQIFQEHSLVVNIEVPVRVFSGGKFIENLTIKDFEVFEDGKSQKIEAVYLIKKKTIARKEEKKKFEPQTSRNFYLFFQLTDYSPRIQEALQYFVQNVLIPGDKLVVVTSMKTYKMKEIALEVKSREEIVEELRGLIRKDAMMGSAEYRSSLDELAKVTRALAGAIAEAGVGDQRRAKVHDGTIAPEYDGMDPITKIEMLLQTYAATLERLEQSRYIDQYRLLDFAKYLKE
ncbi:MAG: hypothetical protein KAU47_01000 [Candidatus Aminicenantes bacterium]|nr:hypothetical protein [Candidatus Aminicenantes bacterium]